eukprot:GDKI01005518.1.p1 GENE.GDKI01005518.1~~GDKI01005518.1.p1  ORF type:complete len:181 (-),score=47.16 GDKI01005518.1:100-642(-)
MEQGMRLDRLKAIIKEAFGCFDKVGNGTVFQEEVGTIMRYLGQFPTETDVVEKVLREIMEEDPSANVVSYDAFERVMLKCMLNHEYDPDDSDTLLAAFRVLDPEGLGYIEEAQMKEYLASGAVGFREKELKEFFDFAKDRDSLDTNRIYYEDYVAKMTEFVEKHIDGLYSEPKSGSKNPN